MVNTYFLHKKYIFLTAKNNERIKCKIKSKIVMTQKEFPLRLPREIAYISRQSAYSAKYSER